MNPTVNAMGRCQVCRNVRATQHVTYHRNVGMLIMRRTIKIQGDMCKTCSNKLYWEFLGKNLLLGPWGIISLIMTPIYIVMNTATYLGALYKLRDAPE